MKTSEELHALHRELWGWLAETGNEKSNWPRWGEFGGSVSKFMECFACEEGGNRGSGKCGNCPIKEWGGSCIVSGTSPYYKWINSDTSKDRKRYAAIIRDLPWSPRPEVKA